MPEDNELKEKDVANTKSSKLKVELKEKDAANTKLKDELKEKDANIRALRATLDLVINDHTNLILSLRSSTMTGVTDPQGGS
jgi:uncharacterized protein YlxW (UPF0749 family)